MDKNRLFVIGAVLVMVVVVVIGWIVGVQPQLAAAAASSQSWASVLAQNASSEAALAGLKKDYARIDELKAQRKTLQEAIPQGTDMSTYIDELHALEVANHVTITSITVSDGQPYVPPAPAAPAPSSTATPAPTPTPTATPAPKAGATTPAPKLPLINKDNFTLMPIQLAVTGKYADVLDFVNGLQTGTRLTLVTTFTSSPSTATDNKGTVVATIGGFVYVLKTAKPVQTPSK